MRKSGSYTINCTVSAMELAFLVKVLQTFRTATVTRICSGDLQIEEEGYGTAILALNYPAKDRTLLVLKPDKSESKEVKIKMYSAPWIIEEFLGVNNG